MLRVLAGIEGRNEWNCGFFEGKWDFGFLFFGLGWLRDSALNGKVGYGWKCSGALISHFDPVEQASNVYESLENRQMFSITMDANIAPSQSVGAQSQIQVGKATSKAVAGGTTVVNGASTLSSSVGGTIGFGRDRP